MKQLFSNYIIRTICVLVIMLIGTNGVFAQAKIAFVPKPAAYWNAPSATAAEIKAKKMAYIITNYADLKRIVAEEKRGSEIGISIAEMEEATRLEAAKNPNPNISLAPHQN